MLKSFVRTLSRSALMSAAVLLSSAAAVAVPSETFAQPSTALADTARLRLAPLKWLVGEWEGPATGTSAGRSFTVQQHETVIDAANGTVLLIQGRGKMEGQTVFEAAGLVSYDMGTRTFKWVSSGGTGYLGSSEAQVKGDTLIWFAPAGPKARTRYIIWKSAKGEWRETGETSEDNTNWVKTFDMTLVRKK